MEKALVKNAASEKQVAKARKAEKSGMARDRMDLEAVLETVSGRRLLWRIMGKCKTFESVWESSARIHYNAGQQDIGHWLMQEINDTNQDAFLKMIKENRKGENNV